MLIDGFNLIHVGISPFQYDTQPRVVPGCLFQNLYDLLRIWPCLRQRVRVQMKLRGRKLPQAVVERIEISAIVGRKSERLAQIGVGLLPLAELRGVDLIAFYFHATSCVSVTTSSSNVS